MNILMFSADYFPPKQLNANHHRLLRLAEGLNKEHNLIIFCPNNSFSYSQSRYNCINIVRFPNLNVRWLNKLWIKNSSHIYLKKLLKKEKLELDLLWYNSAHASILSKHFSCKKIYDVMGLVQLESVRKDTSFIARLKQKYYAKSETSALMNADYIITINNAHKSAIRRLVKKNIFVLRDGFNDFFLKEYVHKKNKVPKVAFVGSFFKDRLNELMPVIVDLSKDNLQFEIIGDGKYLGVYKKITSKYSDANVRFLGHLNNLEVYHHLKDADLCFSDDWSYIGFPTKVFEYMAMGKVALVEDTPAVREIVKNGVNGLLYSDSIDFARKVCLLLNDSKLRRLIEKNAKLEAKKHTWEKRQKEFNAIIKEVMKHE